MGITLGPVGVAELDVELAAVLDEDITEVKDELVTELSKTLEPYTELAKKLKPKLNGDDGIYMHSHGSEQVVSMDKTESGGFKGVITVGIDPSADHKNDEGMGPGRPGGSMGFALVLLVVSIVAVAAGLGLRNWRRRITGQYVALPTAEQEETLSAQSNSGYRDQE